MTHTFTMEQEARFVARRSALGQLYCRDAHNPMTGRELLETYRRHYREVLALMQRVGYLPA